MTTTPRGISMPPPSSAIPMNLPKSVAQSFSQEQPRSPSNTSTSSSLGSSPRKKMHVDVEGTLFVQEGDVWTKCYGQLAGSTLYVYETSDCDDLHLEPIHLSAYSLSSDSTKSFVLVIKEEEQSHTMTRLEFRVAAKDRTAAWRNMLATATTTSSGSKKQKVIKTTPIDLTTQTIVKLPSTPPAHVMHLVLIRHGHYVNAYTRHALDSDQVLSHIGRQQAELTGRHLHDRYASAPSRDNLILLHSDMERAVETASIVSTFFSDCVLSSTPLLREGWPGAPSDQQSHLDIPALPLDDQASEDERLEQAFKTTFAIDGEDRKTTYGNTFRMVVCHANLIRYFLCRALGIKAAGVWGQFEINHCGITRIDVSPHGTCKVLAVNESGHLPPSLLTTSEDHL
ncbi:unnamed protein product [Aphanomyces euteiches]